jgi:hypothetical protein
MFPPPFKKTRTVTLQDYYGDASQQIEWIGFGQGGGLVLANLLQQQPIHLTSGDDSFSLGGIIHAGDLLWRLVRQIRKIDQEVQAIDRLLRLGASTEMICRHHGLTHQEVALRREIIGLPKKKGASSHAR